MTFLNSRTNELSQQVDLVPEELSYEQFLQRGLRGCRRDLPDVEGDDDGLKLEDRGPEVEARRDDDAAS